MIETPPLYISTDNAFGSSAGDVDDGLALLYLISQNVPISKIFSVAGNTSESQSLKNTYELMRVLGAKIPVFSGSSQQIYLLEIDAGRPDTKSRLLELGPLTNLGNFLKLATAEQSSCIGEVLILGTTLKTFGRWPPIWPFEYNLTKDRGAAKEVFTSNLDLLIFPLDVAKQFRFSIDELRLGDERSTNWLKKNVRRWFDRNRKIYFKSTAIIWDAIPAIYVTHPHLFKIEDRFIDSTSRAFSYASAGRKVRAVVDFNLAKAKETFLESLTRIRIL